MQPFDTPFDTHQVFNQAPPFADVDLFACDAVLREALRREGGGAAVATLAALGRQLGQAEVLELGRLANANPPELHNFDRAGRRIDVLEFHPAWHRLMAMMIEARRRGASPDPSPRWRGPPPFTCSARWKTAPSAR